MSHDPLHVVAALVTLVAIGWIPGLGLCRALSPGGSRLTALAAAPAVSAGALYASGELLTALGLDVDWRLALAGCAAGLVLLVWRERGSWAAWVPPRSAWSVPAAWALGAGIWAAGIRHLLAVPPHDDGFNHGFFVARIARFHTLAPHVVMPHDVVSGGHGVSFYPLALHQQAAILVGSLHLDVALSWTLVSLGITVLALPLGMYAVGCHLFPDNGRAASLCALAAALAPGVTYSTSWWGGYALAAGLAATPGVLLLALDQGLHPARLLTTALGFGGLIGIHTSEFTFLGVLAGVLLVLPPLVHRQLGGAARAAAGLAVCAALALGLLIPALVQLHQGLSERSYPVPSEGLPVARSIFEVLVQFSFVPPATPAAIVLALWVGLVVCLRGRVARTWAAAWAVFGLLYIWLASFPSRLINDLTATWYSDPFRLAYLLAFLAIPLIALAVAGPGRPAGSTLHRLWRTSAAALGVVLAVTTTLDSISAIRANYRDYSLVGPDERAAFSFLAAHVGPGQHVLNQHQDGSPWMYSLNGVAPLQALKAFDYSRPEWADAIYLARHVGQAGHDARVNRLLAAFDVHFVYIGPGIFPNERPDIEARTLADSPAFRLVFSRGRTKIFERI